ncbi:hypothetical protein HPB49_008905 [Dermacentor silvarum]|uniref:Uncharacterized protein n=1 Tax=Dermacentor silvarum TaxID=543639 RepID=A0ACB8DIT5_DERSI|nr:hypothetical protein HPB49_008905 [Dermacentor silvarum]
MCAVEYMKRLQDLLKQLGEERLEFYLGWCLLQAMWRFISKLYSQVRYRSVRSALDTVVERSSHADCIELTERLLELTAYPEFSGNHVDAEASNDVNGKARTIAVIFVKQVRRGRCSFISDHVALDQRDFYDVLFHSERLSKQDLSDVFDTVAMNISLLHNWMAVARANARIPDEEWREVTSSYMRQLRESDGYAFFDSQRLAVRIPPLFPMLPLYERDLTVAAKYGTIGTLLGAAAARLFESRLPHNSVALAKVEETRLLGTRTWVKWSTSSGMHSRRPIPMGQRPLAILATTPVTQRFVIMCHLLCKARTSLPVEFSCNQIVKNSRVFARVFKCEVGSPMNPEKKCDFFSYT